MRTSTALKGFAFLAVIASFMGTLTALIFGGEWVIYHGPTWAQWMLGIGSTLFVATYLSYILGLMLFDDSRVL